MLCFGVVFALPVCCRYHHRLLCNSTSIPVPTCCFCVLSAVLSLVVVWVWQGPDSGQRTADSGPGEPGGHAQISPCVTPGLCFTCGEPPFLGRATGKGYDSYYDISHNLWQRATALPPAGDRISYSFHNERRMLLRRIGLIGGFVFHGGAARRACAGYSSCSAALQHQVPIRSSLFHQRASTSRGAHSSAVVPTRHRVATTIAMSSTSAAGEQTTKVVPGVRELCDKYDGFILDQFGVLHGEHDDSVLFLCVTE